MKKSIAITLFILCTGKVFSREEQLLPFGNFDSWRVRLITESVILGGETKRVYAIAPKATVKGEIPYTGGASPWATSNVMAVIAGITKTSNSVFPARRGEGYCARMETLLVTCKVLGVMDISVVASGSIFLGRTMEPIKSTSNPYEKLDMGVSYTGEPKAVVFDYSSSISKSGKLTKATGISVTTLSGHDPAEVILVLQRRSEDAAGNITAQRVGAARFVISESTDGWVDNYSLPIVYGSESRGKIPFQSGFYARNSKGTMVPVIEKGLTPEGDNPTHIILMFSSGSKGAYTGAIGNTLLVDNVRLSY